MFWNQKIGWYGKQIDKNIEGLSGGDLSRIPWIFCVFTENHVQTKVLAAKALGNVLTTLRFDDIIKIDSQMRQTTSMEWSIDWRKLKIEDFFTSKMNDEEKRAVLVFSSFNPNGFIREQSVRLMADFSGTTPYIILRQNDWVQQVRQAAGMAFYKKMQHIEDEEILNSLSFAEKLKWSSRGSHGEYTQSFFEKLLSPKHEIALTNGLVSKNVRTRRICINALLGSQVSGLGRAVTQLELERDPFLRSMLFKGLMANHCNLDKQASELLKDKYPRNRIMALRYYVERELPETYSIAKQMLLDKNASVREESANIIQSFELNFDFRSFYRSNILINSTASILGLGEHGDENDIELLNGYLFDERLSVVRAAMISLLRLNLEGYIQTIIDMLDDNRIGVVKTAYQLIHKLSAPDYNRIHDIFLNTTNEYVKIKTISLLFTAPKWNRLEYMIEVLSCECEKLQSMALISINRWLMTFNKSFSEPDESQKNRICLLIDIQKGRLPKPIYSELKFFLK